MPSGAIQKLEGGRRLRGFIKAEQPLVSIITVVFRAKDGLEQVLKNVSELIAEDVEVIIIDGNSQDCTVDLLQAWNDKIDYWLSEPDKGIYDAMNKAREIACGHFLYHLNVGDRLLSVPRAKLRQARADSVDVVSFRVSVDGSREFRPSSGFWLRLKNTLHHQGTFYRREGFPAYDLRFPRFADFDVNQRLLLAGAKMRLFEDVVAVHDSGGVGDQAQGYDETSAILRKNFGWPYTTLSIAYAELKGIKIRRQAALRRWIQRRGLGKQL